MRDLKTYISVKILYFFRRSWLTQILIGPLREEFLPENFILGVLLNGSGPCFESKLRGTNSTSCAFPLSAI